MISRVNIKMPFIAILSFCISSSLFADMSVAPFGSGSTSGNTPIGLKRSGSDCKTKNCLEFVVKPSCFGTNLRAYSADTQMKDDEDVIVELNLQKEGKTDLVSIQYPATLTFDVGGVRRDCTINLGQDMTNASPKDIVCKKVGTSFETDTYTLLGWKSSTNPSCYANGGSMGLEYCNYAGIILQASKSGSDNLNCIYKFSGNSIDQTKISCLFENELEDKSSLVKVKLNGTLITNDIEKVGYINKVSTELSKTFNTVNSSPLVHHGKLLPIEKPEVSYEFFQLSSNGTKRAIANIVESAGFDEANGNRSFTMVVKHPGVEGFCGGFYSPLMLFFDEKVPAFSGVSLFPLYGVDKGSRVYWPEAYSPGYFLVDMKGDDKVKSYKQLFGKDQNHANGFDALKIHDSNKDNIIDSKDKAFASLKLWQDKNSNGLSDKGELFSLKDKGVQSIKLKYSSKNLTKFGNRARAREKSTFEFTSKGRTIAGKIYDIWLSPLEK
jgi:hypothetical protein